MIVFDLICQPVGHRFEGWFGSSDDFAKQQTSGLLACPHCGASAIVKAPMAPSVPRKGNQMAASRPPETTEPDRKLLANTVMPLEAEKLMQALAEIQKEVLKGSRDVGQSFAAESRAIHYGEREVEAIHGQATLAEAKDLIDEGIAVVPLPFPVAQAKSLN